MQRLEVSDAVRPIYGSLGVKRLTAHQRWQQRRDTTDRHPQENLKYKFRTKYFSKGF
jgi:hypothetical protein